MNYLRKINLKIIGIKNKNNVCMHFRKLKQVNLILDHSSKLLLEFL